jgi:DNA-binding transcriptional MerR regulator
MPVADDMIALPMDGAAKLAEVSQRQLRYWQETNLLKPTIRRQFSEHRQVRLYTFQDLTALLVTAELLERGFSLQHVRRVVEHLRTFGINDPMTELRFATTRKEIYFQYPDRTWSGSARPGQLVFHTIIPLDPIYSKIRDAVRRPPDTHGRIVKRRGVHGSKPVFDGTRIPVQAVLEWLEQGFKHKRILDAYPDLVQADIDAARRHAVAA